MPGWLLQTFATRDPDPMLTLYKAIVLPHLEYGCQLRSTTTIGYIRKVECVQRSITARLSCLRDLNYWERLERLSLYSLERRRERFQVIYIWKIINGIAPTIDGNSGSDVEIVESARRGQYCKVPNVNRRAVVSVQTMLEATLPVSGAKLFNSLPRYLREYKGTLSAFKGKLDEYLRGLPDRPHLPHYYLAVQSNSLAAVN